MADGKVIRFDKGSIRLGAGNAPTPEWDGDTLRLYLRFRKIGELTYLDSAGNRRIEKVTARNLYDAGSMRSAAMKPITNGHPPSGLLTNKNSRDFMRGMTGMKIIRDDPYAVIVGTVTDKELQDGILHGDTQEVSSGYLSRLIDGEQTDVLYNHFAGVKHGRAGQDVGFLLSNDALECLKNFPDIATQALDARDEHELFGAPLLYLIPYDFGDVQTDSSETNKPMPTAIVRTIRIDDNTTINVGDGEGERILADHLEKALLKTTDLSTQLAAEKTRADAAEAKVQEQETLAATEKARADLAESKLQEQPNLDEQLKQARQDGFDRAQLELRAASLPLEYKIDSSMSSRDIKHRLLCNQLRIAVDSERAKEYAAMADSAFEGAYKVTVLDGVPVQTSIVRQPVSPNNDGGYGSGRKGKPDGKEKPMADFSMSRKR